jgi:hypothetical protein
LEVVVNAFRRREIEAADAIESRVEDRVDDDVERSEAHADDGADLARKAVPLPVRLVVAELEIDPVEERLVRGIGDSEQGAQLDAVEFDVAVARQRIDGEIGAELEPVIDAIGPFRNAIQGVVRNDASREIGDLASFGREVVV